MQQDNYCLISVQRQKNAKHITSIIFLVYGSNKTTASKFSKSKVFAVLVSASPDHFIWKALFTIETVWMYSLLMYMLEAVKLSIWLETDLRFCRGNISLTFSALSGFYDL